MRTATQVFYARYMRLLKEGYGEKLLSEINGQDVRRWHRGWLEHMGERNARACIQTLRRVVSYGCELRDKDCLELTQVLAKTTFSTPAARKRRPTYEQIEAFRVAAYKDGRESIKGTKALPDGRASLALMVTLQFDLGLRQKDVIGEWSVPDPRKTKGVEGWDWGLRWSHIDSNHILKKPTSKSNGRQIAEHDLKLYPDVMKALARVPRTDLGPVIINEKTGRPWSKRRLYPALRRIAKAAGWPDDLWNMDTRAGAVSEAFEAGAAAEDVMRTATHTQMATTMGYNRGTLIQSSRVAELRVARRGSKPENAA